MVVWLSVLAGSSSAMAKVRWDRLPELNTSDFRPEVIAKVEEILNAQRCYGRCEDSIAACLDREPPSPTAVRLARDVFRLVTSGVEVEQVKQWLALRKQMAHPEKVHQFELKEALPLGAPDAPVVIVEFTDFQCPFCARVSPDLNRLVRESKGQARLYLKQFPLKSHPRSVEASKACVAAGKLGKFWELCERLFELQPEMAPADILALATKVGLDANALQAAMAKEDVLGRIADEKLEGLKHHVDATPAIFINGKEVLLPPTPELLRDRIEEELDILAGRD
jgi:protein-disulfide isomerase